VGGGESCPIPPERFYLHLNDRYKRTADKRPPPDKADRVILVVRPTGTASSNAQRPVRHMPDLHIVRSCSRPQLGSKSRTKL